MWTRAFFTVDCIVKVAWCFSLLGLVLLLPILWLLQRSEKPVGTIENSFGCLKWIQETNGFIW